MGKVWPARPVAVRRGLGVLALFLASVFAISVSAAPVALAEPVQEASGVCDPIDASACLLPWPNDYFTTADPSTTTGLRLNVSALATPRNEAGAPLDPIDWNRLDGFSPGSQIVTHVAEMDNPQAFANTTVRMAYERNLTGASAQVRKNARASLKRVSASGNGRFRVR